MTLLQDECRVASDILDRLDQELATKREQLAKYAVGVAWNHLARVKLAGGVISSSCGFLREMQTVETEVRILERAVRIQSDVVTQRKQIVSDAELVSLSQQRERLAQSIATAFDDLTRQLDEFAAVEHEVCRRDPETRPMELDCLRQLSPTRAA